MICDIQCAGEVPARRRHKFDRHLYCACCRYGKFNIQAGTQFCDKSFSEEIAKGQISSTSLDRYTCVALAGVSAEYLKFGRAEGGLGDVQQLDALLRAIGVKTATVDTQSTVSLHQRDTLLEILSNCFLNLLCDLAHMICQLPLALDTSRQLILLLQFTQKKTDGQIRWAVLNVSSLLRRHSKTHEKLAHAMAEGSSVAACIGVIEGDMQDSADI